MASPHSVSADAPRRQTVLRPLRPKPTDFRERYIEMGWEWICQHYGAAWKTVVRWIDEEGREDLKAARRAYVRQHGMHFLHPVR